ncbi:MAG: tetratricopeptide (TPR) repeat protein [Saprospiraceae bacterium]|jgi:tetratricopeptide (TPR) repeat protein
MAPPKFNFNTTISLLIIFICSWSKLSGTNPFASEGDTYALIIGVADYDDAQITDLQYSDDDAIAFYDYLTGPAGGRVDSNNIRLLLQDQATVASVYNSMKYFKDKLGRGDKFFIYFAGHGDAEPSIYNLGYLLTHDTPFHNYINNAIRIEDFNDLATTLSVKKGVEVIVITDACKSGSLTGIDNIHKHALVHDQLIKAQENEIRFASCEPGQLSQENALWGGGRGVFSYYFVKGLQGEADANNDKQITVQEVSAYVKGNVQDEVDDLLLDEQIPVTDGISDKIVAIIPEGFDASQTSNPAAIATENREVNGGSRSMSGLGLSVTQRFVNQLKGNGYFTTRDQKLALIIPTDDYLSQLLEDNRHLIITSEEYNVEDKIIDNSKYIDRVVLSADMQRELKNEVAVAYHDIVQGIINAYLAGDEAELEERRYYNVDKNGYVKYLEMLQIAEKLLESDHPLQRIIEVKKYYLTGIIARLQIPITQNLDSILNIAYKAQLKAVNLEPKAAYAQNELGFVYVYMNDLQKGIEHFQKAIDASHDWAIPYANLSYAYMKLGDNVKAEQQGLKADSLQDNLHLAKTNLGLIYNKEHNYLYAEEYFNKAIKINNRHFLPFNGLGEVYTNLTNYEKADSFYYEGAMRRLNTNFENRNPNTPQYQSLLGLEVPAICAIDSTIEKDDIITLFVSGINSFENQDYIKAISIWQSVIDVDPDNPLAFYYSGFAYFRLQEWEQAELMLNYSIEFYLEGEDFDSHVDEWIGKVQNQSDQDCIIGTYRYSRKPEHYSYFLLGHVYNKWHHYEEAMTSYQEILNIVPEWDEDYKISCLLKLSVLEKLNQWETAELFINNYFSYKDEFYTLEKNAFYDRAINANPIDGYWYFKKGLHLKEYAENSIRSGVLDSILYHPIDKKEFFVETEHYEYLLKLEEAYNPTKLLGKILPSIPSNYIFDVSHFEKKVPGTGESVIFNLRILTPRKDAVDAFKSALKLYFDKDMTADIKYKIGELFVAAGSQALAFPYYNDAVKDKPDRATYRLRAIKSGTAIYENRIVYDHLMKMDMDSTISCRTSVQLAHFSAFKGDYLVSQKMIKKIKTYLPYRSQELEELELKILLLQGNYDAAINAYKSLKVDQSRTHEINYTIARLYGLKGDHSNAKKWLKKAIKAGFYFPFVLDAEPLWYTIFGENGWREKHELKVAPKIYQDAHLVSASYR